MDLWEAILIVVALDVLAGLAMLRVRRRAPAGGFFQEPQRAAAALTVTATIFAVLVGFVFLLSFQSYANARSSTQDEALAALGLFHSAERFPAPVRKELQSDLICYSRAVVDSEWPAMAAEQTSSPLVDRWLSLVASHVDDIDPSSGAETDAVQNFFTETQVLQQARQVRLAEAPRFVPTLIWALLLLSGIAVVGFLLLFADSRELRLSQLMMVTAVTTAVTAGLLIVNFLDRPYGDHAGAITPTAMQKTLATIDREQAAADRPPVECEHINRPQV